MPGDTSNFNAGYNAGTISQVNNVTHNVDIQVGALDAAVRELYAHTAPGAMHNSDDRADAPKCHEETREAVQQDIFSCLAHNDGSQGLVWLTGPAGAGKTAIMGTLCDRLEEMGLLAAAFYFSSHKGSVDRKSKRYFVTTLAYQLQRHPALKERIAPGLRTIIQEHPALFKMSLKEQVETLILRPLRHSQRQPAPGPRLVVAIDGIDECGEDRYENPNRSREKDQTDVLAALLQASNDRDFPCSIIIASRPETWIRRFLDKSAAGRVVEIFLDDKYDPDKDIELFFKSKFSELSRRHGYPPSTWPREQDIKKLVADASGQFVYAATVIRFVDSTWPLPKHQLDIVLSIRPPEGSGPFQTLDALYAAILNLSPSPVDTVLWFKAAHHINNLRPMMASSAWTVDRLFESSEGQAQAILKLPSLVYLSKPPGGAGTDFQFFAPNGTGPPPTDCTAIYSFYHKSFLDYLSDESRCGTTFPGIDDTAALRWIWGRIGKVLECNGPEVSMQPELVTTFKKCAMYLFNNQLTASGGYVILSQDLLARCDTTPWMSPEHQASLDGSNFYRDMFVVVHRECRPYRRCGAGCKKWRRAIRELPIEWMPPSWGSRILFLDRFCIKRVRSVWLER